MDIQRPNKSVALKLLIDCSKHIHELRGDWEREKEGIIKECKEFIDWIYLDKTIRIHTINNQALVIYGREGESLYINTLYVDPNARGQGLARQLINFVIQDWKTNFKGKTLELSVDKNNDGALKLYKSMGFDIVGNAGTTSYKMRYRM